MHEARPPGTVGGVRLTRSVVAHTAIVGLLVMTAACAADPSDLRSVTTEPVAGDAEPATTAAAPTSTSVAAPASTAPASTAPAAAVPEPPAFAEAAVVSADTLGLSGTLEQYREDEVANRLSIKISHHGEEPVRIETLRLSWPGLGDTPPSELDYPVFPGARVDLRVPLGEAVCSSPPQLVEPTPTLAIAAVATTESGEITFPVTDPLGILERIYPRQCKRQAVEHHVAVTIDDEWADESLDPVTMLGTLRVDRKASTEPVTIAAIHGSVLVNMATEDGPVVLAADGASVAVPILATNNRCDSHAIGEAKKPYVFVVDLVIGDDEVSYVVSPDEPGKDALQAGIVGRCPPETDP